MGLIALFCAAIKRDSVSLLRFPLFNPIKQHYVILHIQPDIGKMVRIPGRVIPKTQKMVLDTSLLNTQQYKVGIKGKVEQSRERNNALPYTMV